MQITNLSRFSMFITYIVFNIILFLLFAKKYVYIKFIASVNIIIFIFMFFHDLCNYLNKKNHSRDDKKINGLVDNAYGFYKFVRYFHLTLTFISFFYLFMFCYICYLAHIGEIRGDMRFFVILFGVIGLVVVLKEIILQFSRCLYAGMNEELNLLEQSEPKGRCHYDYHNYWECVEGT
jgi:hypothetical protein